jgi:hypothetical protein
LTGKYFFISYNRQQKLLGLEKDLIAIENNWRKNMDKILRKYLVILETL